MTTIHIDDQLASELRRLAAQQGRTIDEFVADSLRSTVLGTQHIQLPTHGEGGLRPGVNLADNAHVRDIMDGLR